ncbi:MAG TPA: hypothetical protein ENH82_10290 [bacterium]|nr:hypothetical protein [bacterium]
MGIKIKRTNEYIILAGIILATAAGNISTLKNHLVADSWVFVFPRSFSETLRYFFTSIIPPEWEAFWLRPIPMIFFWLDNIIWTGTEWGPHLTNIIFHVLNVWLIWLIVNYMRTQSNSAKYGFNCWLPSLAACLFYGLHPLNVGSAGWVAARFDIMSVTFGLAGMLLLFKWYSGTKKTMHLINGSLMLVISILSKEQGIVFLMVCFFIGLIGVFSNEKDKKRYWNGLTILALIVFVYLIYRFSIFHGIGGYISAQKSLNIIPPIAFFTAMLFPYLNIFPDWVFTATFCITSIIIMSLIFFMWKVRFRSYGRIQRIHIISAAALFILGFATTAPHAGIGFMEIMGHAESRFALISITGFSLLIGIGLHMLIRSLRAYRITLVIILLWAVIAAWRTDVQIQAWKDAGLTAHHIISKILKTAPDPPQHSNMLFFDIPRGNNQFAYIFGIGLKEAVLMNYPGRNDIKILPKSQGRDLKQVNPDRDYVFAYNKSIGELERLFPSKKESEK